MPVDRPYNYLSGHAQTCPLANEISRFLIICAGLELKKSNFQKQMLGFAAYAIFDFVFSWKTIF